MIVNGRPDISFEARAMNGFVHGLKSVWRDAVYKEVISEAEQVPANRVADLESAMAKSPTYQLYGWLERHTQQMSLLGRWGAFGELEGMLEELSAQLDQAQTRHPDRLNLDPNLPLPGYLTETDTHQYPGGLWESDLGGYVLEALTEKASFSMISPEQPLTWYAEHLRDRFNPQRILDLGCARARGTRALKRAMPEASIDGIDLCGPVLRLAHLRNVEESLAIRLWQRNAEETGFTARSFDLVTSHWLIHETPPSALRRIMREGWRLLEPGGTFAMYDMYLTPGGLIGDWLHAGYAVRNNEPFAYPVAELDLKEELRAIGFTEIDIALSGLQATPGALRDELPDSRTHYMSVITARKPTGA